MRTTEPTLAVTLARTPATARLQAMMQVIASAWRLVKNRRALGHLDDLDDRQLADIGLSRSDVRRAATSNFFEDTSGHLTKAARDRVNRYYRDARNR